MATLLNCPACEAPLDLPEAEPGLEVACTHCRTRFRTVPVNSDGSSPSASPVRLEPIGAAWATAELPDRGAPWASTGTGVERTDRPPVIEPPAGEPFSAPIVEGVPSAAPSPEWAIAPPFGPPAEMLGAAPLATNPAMDQFLRLAGQLSGPPSEPVAPPAPGAGPEADRAAAIAPAAADSGLFPGTIPLEDEEDEDDPELQRTFPAPATASGAGVVMIGDGVLRQQPAGLAHPALDALAAAPGGPAAGPAVTSTPASDDLAVLPPIGTTVPRTVLNLVGGIVLLATVFWVASWGWALWGAPAASQGEVATFLHWCEAVLAAAFGVGMYAAWKFFQGKGRIACLIFDLLLLGWCARLWPRVSQSRARGDSAVAFFSVHASSPGLENIILWGITVAFALLTLAIFAQFGWDLWRGLHRAKLQPSGWAARASSSDFPGPAGST